MGRVLEFRQQRQLLLYRHRADAIPGRRWHFLPRNRTAHEATGTIHETGTSDTGYHEHA